MNDNNSKQFKHRSSFLHGTLATSCGRALFNKEGNDSMTLPQRFGRRILLATSFLLAAGLFSSLATPAFAQYMVTNLVSNQNTNGANPADPVLVNAWASRRWPRARSGFPTTAPGNPLSITAWARNRAWS